MKRVFVTSHGVFNSNANCSSALFNNLKNQSSSFALNSTGSSYYLSSTCKEPTLKEVMEHCDKFNLSDTYTSKIKSIFRKISSTSKSSLMPAIETIGKIGSSYKDIDKRQTSIIVAGHNFSKITSASSMCEFNKRPNTFNPRYSSHFMDSEIIGALSYIFGIEGPSFTLGASSASGNLAIIEGCEMIKSQRVNHCLIVGPPPSLSEMEIQSFINIGAMYSRSSPIDHNCLSSIYSPLSTGNSGFVYGESSAAILLSSHQSRADEASIIGHGQKLSPSFGTEPSLESEILAMRLALDSAEIDTDSIDYISTHGSGSALGDSTESQAIHELFRNNDHLLVNSIKEYTGHSLSCSSIVEIIASIQQMEHQTYIGNINCKSPLPLISTFIKRNNLITTVKFTLSNAFGFFGFNSSIVLKI